MHVKKNMFNFWQLSMLFLAVFFYFVGSFAAFHVSPRA